MVDMDSTQIRISGKDLGQLALPDYCERCFWLKRRSAGKLPFQVFPGIFSSIDSYTKKIVHGYFDTHHQPPPWLSDLHGVVGYIDPPHFSKFQFVDATTNVLLTGAADGILKKADGSILIIDYKTAKFTENQDSLLPIYEVQLNSYALIAQMLDYPKVSGLALIYMEPLTTDEASLESRHARKDGFAMTFTSHVKELVLDTTTIPPLLSKLRSIFDLPSPPIGSEGCKDCLNLNGLLKLVQS